MDPDAVWNGEWGRSNDGCIRWGGDRRRGRSSFGSQFGASRYNQWDFDTLLHSCAEVCEPIELSFGVVSGVGGWIAVLDGGARAARERGRVAGVFFPINLTGTLFSDVLFSDVLDSCVKS